MPVFSTPACARAATAMRDPDAGTPLSEDRKRKAFRSAFHPAGLHPQMRRTYLTDVAAIFLLAFFLRCFYWWFLKENDLFYGHPGGDVTYYQRWAGEIADGHWTASALFRGLPLYPHFLAVLERLTLNHMALVRAFHLALGAVNCGLTYILGRTLFSRKAGILSGVLMAGSFTAIHYDWLMIPVPLLIFLSLVIVLTFLSAGPMGLSRGPRERSEQSERSEWFILGALIGMAVLGDGKMLIFAALVSAGFFLKGNNVWRRHAFTIVLLLAAGALLFPAANGLRNKIFGGDWIWVSSQGGLSFYVGNNSCALGLFENPGFIRPTHEGQDEDQAIVAQTVLKRTLTPAQVSGFWRGRALEFIGSHPREYLRLLLQKTRLFLTETENSYDLDLLLQRDWKAKADINPFWLMAPLAAAGMIASRRVPGTGYVNSLVLSQVLISLIFFLTHRHRATVLPFLIIYEAYAVLELVRHFQSKNFKFICSVCVFLAGWMFLFRPQAMAPKDVDFYRLTKSAAVREEKKDFSGARALYQRALELRPADTNAMYNLANACTRSGDWASARAYYEKILILNPDQVDALYNLGFAQAREGNYEAGFATIQRLLLLQPASPDVLFLAGEITQKLGRCVESGMYFQRLLQLYPRLKNQVDSILKHCP
ncbi:MAG: tetratricopeptide repeat protein [Candidatus Omnitrophica bacterium]|nr:tetratricopeptide repeat protein [Candidatus Omnitrophota bacterium]